MIADIDTFTRLAEHDFEFKRETRYLTGTIKLEATDSVLTLAFVDGILEKTATSAVDDGDCTIVVRATDEQWDALLAPKPEPFYQCLQSSNIKHGLFLSGSDKTFAYLPALNRMTTLLRSARSELGAGK